MLYKWEIGTGKLSIEVEKNQVLLTKINIRYNTYLGVT